MQRDSIVEIQNTAEETTTRAKKYQQNAEKDPTDRQEYRGGGASIILAISHLFSCKLSYL